MKKVIAFLLSGICIVAIYFAWRAISFITTPAQTVKKEIVFDIPGGASFGRIAHNLESEGIIKDARLFSWYAKLTNQTTNIKTGEYKLSTDMRPKDVLDIIVSGQSITYSLTVPEGFNIYEIRDELNKMWPGKGDEFLRLVRDPTFIKNTTGSDLISMEGYLFPETYIITKYTSVETLARRMYNYFTENIKKINAQAQIKMPLHDQVILASVIEKETGAPSERPLISSVFHNRLKKRMRLQSDPTILYGMLNETQKTIKNISKSDILRPTPFNTYTVKALPVGPIANPGREALLAAVRPDVSDYLYFVSRNDGTHVFSETYKEHDAAVKKFQLDRKMREGKSWRNLNQKRATQGSN
ncbi:MAG: endolytic transglycosylase MltG [Bdellovibrionales bacterium]|nr:endolytic transglycosylase MltG [Bdellovibrionales bacterium]